MYMQFAARRRRAGGGVALPPTLTDQVLAILAGRPGSMFDPTDKATMWQDAAKTIPVTADGQPVAKIVAKGGTVARNWTNGALAQEPLLSGGMLLFDGVASRLLLNDLAIIRNAGAAEFIASIVPIAVEASRVLFNVGISNNATTARWAVSYYLTSQLEGILRRPDAAGFSRARGGLLTNGVRVTIGSVVDPLGTLLHTTRINAVQAAQVAILAPAAPFEDTNSLQVTLGAGGAVNYAHVKIGRHVIVPFTLTPAERLTIEAWVAEGAVPTFTKTSHAFRPGRSDPLVGYTDGGFGVMTPGGISTGQRVSALTFSAALAELSFSGGKIPGVDTLYFDEGGTDFAFNWSGTAYTNAAEAAILRSFVEANVDKNIIVTIGPDRAVVA